MDIDIIIQCLSDFGILTLNGLLEILYVAWEQGTTLLALFLAAATALGPDRQIRHVAGHRPRRRGRGQVTRASFVPMALTGITALAWTVASVLSRAPVPLWGVLLWLALLIGALALPQEQENVLWTHKGLILGYAALAVGLRVLFQSPASTLSWSAVMGVEESSVALLSTLRNALGPWAVILAWAIYPISALGLLGQRLFINRMRLISPMTTARDTIEALRTRGG